MPTTSSSRSTVGPVLTQLPSLVFSHTLTRVNCPQRQVRHEDRPDRQGHSAEPEHPKSDTPTRRRQKRRLTTTTFVSVDGVMQGIGGPDEDGSGGFERGGWTVTHFDKETATLVSQVYGRAEAFLLGRRTYEIFVASWGAMADPGDNPIAVALNTLPKYVASTTLTDPRWANTTVLSSEVAAAVGELKAKPGRELQVHGSRTLIRWLLDNDLVDEITLLTFPVSLARARGCFLTPARTQRSKWSNRGPPPVG
jgi:dihydrofolate reductase